MDQVTRVGGPMLSYGDHNVSIPFESEEEVACSFLIEWTPRQCPLGRALRSS